MKTWFLFCAALTAGCGYFRGEQGIPGVNGVNGYNGKDGASASEEFADQLQTVYALKDNFVVVSCESADATKTGAYYGSGTVTVDGRVLTARHVILNPGYDKCSYYYTDSLTSPTIIGNFSPTTYNTDGRDIAYMRSSFVAGRQPEGLTAKHKSFILGEPLILVSHPEAMYSQQYTFGHVTDINVSEIDSVNWPNAITTDIVAAEGSSGGAVFDANGDLVGILVGGFSDGLDLSVILPI